jgi:hypothetical protein
MEVRIMSSGRNGNNRRRSFKRREQADNEAGGSRRNSRQDNSFKKGKKPGLESAVFKPARPSNVERPKWSPVKITAPPLSAYECPVCGKPIRNVSSAVTDKVSGTPAHFDCILEKIAAGEVQGKGEVVAYLGGGRFGVLHYANPRDVRSFKIKKIIEWEDKDNRAEWRQDVAGHFSIT